MAFPLKRGEYSSPFFETDANEFYEISIEWNAPDADWKQLSLDWRVVDDSGALLEQGSYNYRLRGDIARLAQYHSTRRLRQKVVFTNLQDAQGLALAHPKFEINLPERGLDLAYGLIDPIKVAFMVAGPGVLLLLCLLVVRGIQLNARQRS
jgi:hypothetical protein